MYGPCSEELFGTFTLQLKPSRQADSRSDRMEMEIVILLPSTDAAMDLRCMSMILHFLVSSETLPLWHFLPDLTSSEPFNNSGPTR
jgi:hypothetical protein